MIGNPDQSDNASTAVFINDPRLCRTYTEPLKEKEEIVLETVHGVTSKVQIPINGHTRLIEIDDIFYER